MVCELFARKSEQLAWIGDGLFKAIDIEADEVVPEPEAGLDEEPANGWLYAFHSPIFKKDGDYPIKIGKTNGDVAVRVKEQTRGIFTQAAEVISE